MVIYEYQRPLGKIEDNIALRNQFISLYETKSHREMAIFSLRYGQHLLAKTGFDDIKEITASFQAIQKWLDGKTNYHEARNISGELSALARIEQDPIKARFFRTMAQISGVPHVKYHALWATDFAITLINRMSPGNQEEVQKERETQMMILRQTTDERVQ